MMSPLPTLARAFSLIKWEEKQRQGSYSNFSFIVNARNGSKSVALGYQSARGRGRGKPGQSDQTSMGKFPQAMKVSVIASTPEPEVIVLVTGIEQDGLYYLSQCALEMASSTMTSLPNQVAYTNVVQVSSNELDEPQRKLNQSEAQTIGSKQRDLSTFGGVRSIGSDLTRMIGKYDTYQNRSIRNDHIIIKMKESRNPTSRAQPAASIESFAQGIENGRTNGNGDNCGEFDAVMCSKSSS
ncbi:hypothetical protein AgCh_000475 [Apium graveolens]